MSNSHFGRCLPIVFRNFPDMVAHSLDGKMVKIPSNLEGKLNILLIGFKRSHFVEIESWLPFANEVQNRLNQKQNNPKTIRLYSLILQHPFSYYCFGLGDFLWRNQFEAEIYRRFDHVIGLFSYFSKKRFIAQMQLPDSQRVYILLVKQNGEICWCQHDACDALKKQHMLSILQLEKEFNIETAITGTKSKLQIS
ncbi:hypothetical protein IE077_003236 [Cardiosporidium cionae]|uniref:Uncharacterized protein n=1 Tax=Cardiosporidium cionae TaxID=476202 RepID=A0ABQ7JG55_9APIC|nr:hypothetical protein IE077_003236 [Cardiosporidium cionae]|eukprot:KAF8822640.1 hypothetical protein IE077_003236 [Cardiosporidium cionae]